MPVRMKLCQSELSASLHRALKYGSVYSITKCHFEEKYIFVFPTLFFVIQMLKFEIQRIKYEIQRLIYEIQRIKYEIQRLIFWISKNKVGKDKSIFS